MPLNLNSLLFIPTHSRTPMIQIALFVVNESTAIYDGAIENTNVLTPISHDLCVSSLERH